MPETSRYCNDYLSQEPAMFVWLLAGGPPKKVLDKKVFKNNLIKQRLVPSCLLYFGWSDLDETKWEHGPFMNLQNLKDKIVDDV